MNVKINDIKDLENQIDLLNNQLKDVKNKHRKEHDSKEIELNTLKLNYDSVKIELASAQKDLKQLKTRFDAIKTKEKENQSSFIKSLAQLESENEKLNNKYLDLSKESEDWQNKYESNKCQLNKYELLIDNLNEQVILLKRELKENQMNLNEISQSYEGEREMRGKLEAKLQEVEPQISDYKQLIAKHENCEKNFFNFQMKVKQIQQSLNTK